MIDIAIFKCKMCGAPLSVDSGMSIVTCNYCQTQQTLPKLDDEKRLNMYDRANHFRRNSEFDKAEAIYEQILNEDITDAEAYWSLVLCRYGIEYVEDPLTLRRKPTVHRAQFTSVFDDDNYKLALQNADVNRRCIYEEEARVINEIQKGILAISQKEEPFDVFICYKEKDKNGNRTLDSVLAMDLYNALTKEGLKVFFARITLEKKLGVAYEPYIFAALNSAKVMVVVGTSRENLDSRWVKNEWKRYLTLIKNGADKMLIPAYRDMDPYDLPEEFSHLQAQNMEKIGFTQDLVYGIKKVVNKSDAVADKGSSKNEEIKNYLKRVNMFLDDSDFKNADDYCEKVLDMDPENVDAYLGKLMAEVHVSSKERLCDSKVPLSSYNSYKKLSRLGDEALVKELSEYNNQVSRRLYQEKLIKNYDEAISAMQNAVTVEDFQNILRKFGECPGFRDTDKRVEQCNIRIKYLEKQNEKNRIKNLKLCCKRYIKRLIPQFIKLFFVESFAMALVIFMSIFFFISRSLGMLIIYVIFGALFSFIVELCAISITKKIKYDRNLLEETKADIGKGITRFTARIIEYFMFLIPLIVSFVLTLTVFIVWFCSVHSY